MQRCLVPTGISIALPAGFEAQIRPRSGLAAKHGITVLNSPGTIDADYRGEIKAILINLSSEPFTINNGDRICQMVVARCEQVKWQPVDSLDATERGEGGFGHSVVRVFLNSFCYVIQIHCFSIVAYVVLARPCGRGYLCY